MTLGTFSFRWLFATGLFAVSLVSVFATTTGGQVPESKAIAPLPKVPMTLPAAEADGHIYITDSDGQKRQTTIEPEIQKYLDEFLDKNAHNPIAAVVLADVKTGRILAMSQGRNPQVWEGKTHSALHTGFPAASLFKTIVTAAAIDLAGIDPDSPQSLIGGCSQVGASGVWMYDKTLGRGNAMPLKRAYGNSCNGYFAKLAVNDLGLSVVTNYARRFGWTTGFPADFAQEPSPFRAPSPRLASAHSVGQFAAGFGQVGVSAVHAAWTMLTIANNGHVKPILLFADTPVPPPDPAAERLLTDQSATTIRQIMASTVRGGTASFAFRRGKTKKLRELAGGKTGTLTGSSPRGLTTWFAGMMPLENPEVVVAAVVVLDTVWYTKGPSLAAEALWKYDSWQEQRRLASAHTPGPVASTP
jgi:cell division protein FtsI/penicillin-binding protein 2